MSRSRTARWMARAALVAVAGIGALALLTSPLAAAQVTNGDFETGNLSGWTVQNEASTSQGSWFVYSGGVTPLSSPTYNGVSAQTNQPFQPPPQGTFAAVTDQHGSGSHILYQDIALEPNGTHTLSLVVYYQNQNAGGFITPDTLDFKAGPNQQYRIDVMDPSAPVDSLAPNDVLLNVFRTKVGDPNTLAPTTITADLSAFAGRTIRLRLAEVDTELFFHAAVDAVQVNSVLTAAPAFTG